MGISPGDVAPAILAGFQRDCTRHIVLNKLNLRPVDTTLREVG